LYADGEGVLTRSCGWFLGSERRATWHILQSSEIECFIWYSKDFWSFL